MIHSTVVSVLKRLLFRSFPLQAAAVCIKNRNAVRRSLAAAGEGFVAVYNFAILPYALGDILTWNVQSCIKAVAAGRKYVDVFVVADPFNPSNRCQKDFITPQNYRVFLQEMLPAFSVNPMLRNLTVYESQDLFTGAYMLRRLVLDGAGFDISDHLGNLADQMANELGRYTLINDFFARQAHGPSLRMPDSMTERARDLIRNLGDNAFTVAVHLRSRQRSSWHETTTDWDRDADIGVWFDFFRRVQKACPNVRFVLVGRPEEWPSDFRSQPNIILPKFMGLGLPDELALIQECDLFMGSNSGPSVMAIFGTKPYFIFECSEANYGYTARQWGVKVGATRLSFGKEFQEIRWGVTSSEGLWECFERVYTAQCGSQGNGLSR